MPTCAPGGSETTRCGGRDDLGIRTEVRYHLVRRKEIISFSELLLEGKGMLTAARATFEFHPWGPDKSQLVLTVHVT